MDLDVVHQLCIDGESSELRRLFENGDVEVNCYRLFICRPRSSDLTDDDEDEYQSDETDSNAGLIFDYRSLLFDAILHDQLQCVKILIEHGANPLKLRPWGLSGLCLSCSCGHRRLIEYFLELDLGVNWTDPPNATDVYFNSLPSEHEHRVRMREMHCRVAQDLGMFHYPLHILVKQDSLSLLQLFLRFPEKVDWQVREAYTKRTALHLAAEKCSPEILRLLLEDVANREGNPLDLNGHTPLDVVWKLLNNLDYQFEYREETLKLMLSHRCRFSSIRSLTEFYANSLSAFRRFESNFWIVIAYHLPSLFLEPLTSNKILLVQIWIWFNRNYQETLMDDDEFDRHYTGSILRNLIHVMYENEQLTLTNHELVELFTEDLGSHFDKTTDEIDTITTILSTPLKLKQISRNRIRKRLCSSTCGGLNQQTLEHPSLSPTLNDKLRHFILP